MSSFTKVFVLLVSLLAIFLCGVVVTFVASTNNYRDAYEQQLTATEAAMIHAKGTEEASREDGARKALVVEGLKAENQRLMERLDERVRELNRVQQALGESERNARTAVKLSESLQEANGALYAAQLTLQDQLTAAHDQMSRATTQSIAMEQELSSIKAESMQLKATLRRNSEKIAELEDVNAALQQQLLQVELASSEFRQQEDRVSMVRPQTTGVPIRGQISGISDDLASISVGSASGVREGTVFRVVRGGKFLGELEVTLVEPNESAGLLTTHKGTVVEGDIVTTGFD